jgi:hypothetical protein
MTFRKNDLPALIQEFSGTKAAFGKSIYQITGSVRWIAAFPENDFTVARASVIRKARKGRQSGDSR